MQKRHLLTLAVALLAGTVLGGNAMAQDKKEMAFVVNGASDFWKLAAAGVKKAQAELPDYDLQFKYPERGGRRPARLMDDLVAAGVDAIMVSAVDPQTSTDALNRVGGKMPLFTIDSDAPPASASPISARRTPTLGKQAGELMKKAMPNGGKCMGFVGLPGADNAKRAHRGLQRGDQGHRSS